MVKKQPLLRLKALCAYSATSFGGHKGSKDLLGYQKLMISMMPTDQNFTAGFEEKCGCGRSRLQKIKVIEIGAGKRDLLKYS